MRRLSPCVLPLLLVAVGLSSTRAASRENWAERGELPEGPGLAAETEEARGLRGHPDTVFADDFETGVLGERWDETSDRSGVVLSLTAPDRAELGGRCLRVEAHLGRDTGGGLTKWFDAVPVVFVRFYTKFDASCDYVHHFVTLRANRGLAGGDRWSGFGGAGEKPEGSRRFSTAIEPWGDWGRTPPPGKWNFYSYWHEMERSPDGRYWGNSFPVPEAAAIRRGEWICVEFMLKENEPAKADGEQAFWIDGELRGHWKAINWRTDDRLRANALTLESYVTDRWTRNRTNVVFFDDVVIARRYVGPVKATTP